jgi:hypothetical protein
MTNDLVVWICAHPLQFVGGLVGLAGLLGVMLIPQLHELPDRGHPRC